MNLKLFSVMILAVSTCTADAGDLGDLAGTWQRGDGIARANVAPCGATVCMTNIWIKPGVTDEKIGEYIRLDVTPAGPGRWTGSGYDPQRKVTFSANVTVSGRTMTTGGCVAGGLICRSTQWSRLP